LEARKGNCSLIFVSEVEQQQWIVEKIIGTNLTILDDLLEAAMLATIPMGMEH